MNNYENTIDMKEKDNLSLVLHGPDDLRLEQTPLPGDPQSDEVKLATHTVGICGSDVHFYSHGRLDAWVVDKPMIMGHESSATVVAIGKDVTHLKVGDRVAVEPGIPCQHCQFCSNARYNLCRDVVFQSVPPYHGSLRRLYNHKAYMCHKLPDNVSFGEGAMMEPLAVAVHACKRLRIDQDANIKLLVTGAGAIGLLCALTARAYGVQDIVIADINESRLELAKKLGITKILAIKRDEDIKSIIERVIKLLGDSPDVTLECTGVENCFNVAIGATKEGGRVGMVGLNHSKVSVSLTNAGFNELELIGVRRYKQQSFTDAIKMVESKKIKVEPLISHLFRLEEGVEAYETARKCEDGVTKVHILCQS